MTDISNRMAVILVYEEEKTALAKAGKKPEDSPVIAACEAYLRVNPEPPAHDFITLSQPAEKD